MCLVRFRGLHNGHLFYLICHCWFLSHEKTENLDDKDVRRNLTVTNFLVFLFLSETICSPSAGFFECVHILRKFNIVFSDHWVELFILLTVFPTQFNSFLRRYDLITHSLSVILYSGAFCYLSSSRRLTHLLIWNSTKVYFLNVQWFFCEFY